MGEMNVGNIRYKSARRKKSKHNLCCHVNTTSGMTDVQPLFINQCDAGDSNSVSIESMVWVAPLLKPVFGKATYDQWHYFVKMSDLTKHFGEFLTGTRAATGDSGAPKVFSRLPTMTKGALCSLCLYESHMTIWRGLQTSFEATKGRYDLFAGTGDDIGSRGEAFTWFFEHDVLRYDVERSFDGYSGYSVNINRLVPGLFKDVSGGEISGGSAYIPLNNNDKSSFFDRRKADDKPDYSYNGIDESPVYLETADFVVEFYPNGSIYRYAMAFRFSDFGRRLRKVIEGAGIKIDLSSTEEISLMPLFAYFKAYFDCFGLLQYINWEDTACARLLAKYDAKPYNYDFSQGLYYLGDGNVDDWRLELYSYFQEFIRDLSFCYTTDATNFVSAHQRSVNPGVHIPTSDWMDNTRDVLNSEVKDNVDVGYSSSEEQDPSVGSSPFIKQVLHGQLDAELVKRLTLQLNIETVVGQRVYELARAMGLGDWLDKQKVNFIGHASTPIVFGQVMAQADTYTQVTGEGMPLGDRAGKAQGYKQSKTFKYTCDQQGFYVVLAAVMPHVEYSQQDDLKTRCNARYKFYMPRYDGLGFEANPKSAVCGQLDWIRLQNLDSSSPDYRPLQQTFGFAPTYTRLKYLPSRASGDFSLRSTRGYNLPRVLDRFVELNSYAIDTMEPIGQNVATRQTTSFIDLNFNAANFPIGGNIWRYTARYDWLCNLSRIFSVVGQSPDDFYEWGGASAQFYEYFSRSLDNFILQHDVTYYQYSQKLQLGDSYETTDDANDGSTDSNVGKA